MLRVRAADIESNRGASAKWNLPRDEHAGDCRRRPPGDGARASSDQARRKRDHLRSRPRPRRARLAVANRSGRLGPPLPRDPRLGPVSSFPSERARNREGDSVEEDPHGVLHGGNAPFHVERRRIPSLSRSGDDRQGAPRGNDPTRRLFSARPRTRTRVGGNMGAAMVRQKDDGNALAAAAESETRRRRDAGNGGVSQRDHSTNVLRSRVRPKGGTPRVRAGRLRPNSRRLSQRARSRRRRSPVRGLRAQNIRARRADSARARRRRGDCRPSRRDGRARSRRADLRRAHLWRD